MANENLTPRGQLEQMDSELDGVSSVLHMITHVLGGDADVEKPCQTPGLWFSVQHVARVLTKVKEKIIGMDGSPDDLNDSGPLAIEAAGMAQMIDHLLSANGYVSPPCQNDLLHLPQLV